MWNRGRSEKIPTIYFFMTLAVYSNSGAGKFLAAMFGLTTSTFQRMIERYVEAVRYKASQQLANKGKSNLRWNTYRKRSGARALAWCLLRQ